MNPINKKIIDINNIVIFAPLENIFAKSSYEGHTSTQPTTEFSLFIGYDNFKTDNIAEFIFVGVFFSCLFVIVKYRIYSFFFY